MLRIIVKHGTETDECVVNAKEFYDNELEPMISDPAPYGGRKWTKSQRLFFNIPDPKTTDGKNMMKMQSQMRDMFRHFRPNYNVFMSIIKKNTHPLVEMSRYPSTYGKRECEYLVELLDRSELSVGSYLYFVTLSYIENEV
jgi:hypothetical protein